MALAFRTAAIICTIAGVACAAQPAAARDRRAGPRAVAEARIGLIGGPRTQRMAPLLVYRGGYTPINNMVRPRFVGGMVDIYPSTKVGFRMSVGTRYFMRTNFWIEAEQATRGLIYDPRMTRGGIGLMRGFRRYTPAAMVGYDVSPADGLVVGLEGGVIKGRAYQTMRASRMASVRTSEGRESTTEMVTLSARLAF